LVEIKFVTGSEEEAQKWVDEINNKQHETWNIPTPRKPVFILINPYSGKKKALQLFTDVVEPLLSCAGVSFEKVETERPKHAIEIAKNLDVDKYSTIATISGDGLFHEMLQGFMQRKDWRKILSIPLALLPAGSGNGLMKSFNTCGIYSGVFNLIKGYSIGLDMMVFTSADGDKIYSHLALFWGLLADADIESDRYRVLGPARFTVGGIVRIVNLRSYQGILRYLPYESESKNVLPDDIEEIPQQYSATDPHKCPEGWTQLDTKFILFSATNVPWVGEDICIAPRAKCNDGAIDLVWIEREKTTKADLAKILLAVDTGEEINHPCLHYQKVKAFSLIPTDIGIIDIDGEQYSSMALTGENLSEAIQLIVPPQ